MPKLVPLVGSDEETISMVDLNSMINGYRAERMIHFPQTLQDDSTSVWIRKEKFAEFFELNPQSNGIRFYFGTIADPFVGHKIHNLVLVPTTQQEDGNFDQTSENDSVLVTENLDSSEMFGGRDSAICPPPVERCKGRSFTV